jgi:hypothetical protein
MLKVGDVCTINVSGLLYDSGIILGISKAEEDGSIYFIAPASRWTELLPLLKANWPIDNYLAVPSKARGKIVVAFPHELTLDTSKGAQEIHDMINSGLKEIQELEKMKQNRFWNI